MTDNTTMYRVAEMGALLAQQADTQTHVRLMPIGSEVPYEGRVTRVDSGTVELSTAVAFDDEENPTAFARVLVGLDRIEAAVLLPDAPPEVAP